MSEQLEFKFKKSDSEILAEVIHFIKTNECGDIEFIKYRINDLFLRDGRRRPFDE
jgi:hypothetical protein